MKTLLAFLAGMLAGAFVMILIAGMFGMREESDL